MVCKALIALCIFTAGTWRGPRMSGALGRQRRAPADGKRGTKGNKSPLEGGGSAGVCALGFEVHGFDGSGEEGRLGLCCGSLDPPQIHSLGNRWPASWRVRTPKPSGRRQLSAVSLVCWGLGAHLPLIATHHFLRWFVLMWDTEAGQGTDEAATRRASASSAFDPAG